MKKLYGWSGGILKVDVGTGVIARLSTEEYSERFVGGLGIGQKLYWDMASPVHDAFHPEMPLIFMTGPLNATTAPSAPRLVVCGKSPALYPEVFNCASIGGSFAAELKRAGYDGLVVIGKAPQPLYLSISDGRVELKEAKHLWGLTNSEVQRELRRAHGEKVKYLTIGPGAEHGSRIGTIATDAGGSGSRGFGSVMGMKQLKAIVVSGSNNIPAADEESIERIKKQIRQMRGEGFFNLYGQPLSLPTVEVVKKVHCRGCPQGCWRTLQRTPGGLEGVRKCQTPLFYSLWSRKFSEEFAETSFRATTLLDEYSLCVIEVTFLLLWLERCFGQGILSEHDTGLSLQEMGTWRFIEKLVRGISSGEGFGSILAQGVERAARAVGKEALAIVETGRAFPYGPKVFSISSLLYALEPRPPITELHEVCHPLTKWALWYTSGGVRSYVSTEVLRKIAQQFWGSEKAVDFSTYEGKAKAAIKIQNREYAKESLVLCDFAFPVFDRADTDEHVGDPSLESKLLAAVTGWDIDRKGLDFLGDRIFNLNRAIHLREGRKGRADDRLPDTQFIEREELIADVFGMHNPQLYLPGAGEDVISRKGKALDRDAFEEMLSEYYELRGWDGDTGFFKRNTLHSLGLPEVIPALEGRVL